VASDTLSSPIPSDARIGAGRIIALACAVALVAGYYFNPTAALRSYLWVYLYLLSIPVGALALIMLNHLTGGGWGVVLRRPLEAATRTMPLMAVMFLPIAIGAHRLYPWAAAGAEVPFPRSMYLNLPWFWIRAAIYFVLWIALERVLSSWSAMQDEANSPALERRYRLLSGPGLAIMGLTVTFASIDWAMSLEPNWYSSIYGVLFGVGMVLSAFTFGIVVVLKLAEQSPYRGVLMAGHLRDLGSLLLAFVMMWGYLTVSQFLLIWAANLREEVPYFIVRSQHGWQFVIATVVLVIFVLPFIVLLTRDGKRNPRSLGFVAGIILGVRLLELYWYIAPGRPVNGSSVFWTDLVAPLALGGPWLANYLFELKRRPLLPLSVDVSVQEDHHG